MYSAHTGPQWWLDLHWDRSLKFQVHSDVAGVRVIWQHLVAVQSASAECIQCHYYSHPSHRNISEVCGYVKGLALTVKLPYFSLQGLRIVLLASSQVAFRNHGHRSLQEKKTHMYSLVLVWFKLVQCGSFGTLEPHTETGWLEGGLANCLLNYTSFSSSSSSLEND